MNLLTTQKSFLFLSFILVMSFNSNAQKVKPESLEVWEPVPRVVVPGTATAPPSDAIVLFGGKDLSEWKGKDGEAKWLVKDGAMIVAKGTGAIETKKTFGDIQLHIEWRTPDKVEGEGQGRGNSGIFFHGIYELQVLDSYNNKTYPNGQAGSIYKQSIPLVNVCRKPGEWQTYDVVWTSPKFKTDGTLEEPARITVFQNGVLVQNNFSLKGNTAYDAMPEYKAHGQGPISLQDHGNPTSFRNIWLREL